MRDGKANSCVSCQLGYGGPFLKSPGNLLGQVSAFGDKCF